MNEENVRGGSVEIPVDQSLLDPNSPVVTGQWDEAPAEFGSEPYPVPDSTTLSEQAAAAEAEQQVAEQVVTVRDEQSLAIANMGQNGVAHFLVNAEGQELCGGCGQAFPCSKWMGEIEPRNLADSSGQPVPDEDKARAVAELLGVPIERARQVVLASTPLDELADKAGIYPRS